MGYVGQEKRFVSGLFVERISPLSTNTGCAKHVAPFGLFLQRKGTFILQQLSKLHLLIH